MINPVVQILPDAAVLSYNLTSYIDTGESKWNCTEVYKKDGELWKIVVVCETLKRWVRRLKKLSILKRMNNI